mmetsp:Transcript_29713/g.79016  ORF Transcript_29713/g.79016 Transcript_29713/m.79016 type:complete len:299 (+) Transcript_29713:390-1286(+)
MAWPRSAGSRTRRTPAPSGMGWRAAAAALHSARPRWSGRVARGASRCRTAAPTTRRTAGAPARSCAPSPTRRPATTRRSSWWSTLASERSRSRRAAARAAATRGCSLRRPCGRGCCCPKGSRPPSRPFRPPTAWSRPPPTGPRARARADGLSCRMARTRCPHPRSARPPLRWPRRCLRGCATTSSACSRRPGPNARTPPSGSRAQGGRRHRRRPSARSASSAGAGGRFAHGPSSSARARRPRRWLTAPRAPRPLMWTRVRRQLLNRASGSVPQRAPRPRRARGQRDDCGLCERPRHPQ